METKLKDILIDLELNRIDILEAIRLILELFTNELKKQNIN